MISLDLQNRTDVSLSIQAEFIQGTCTCLYGVSGAGKTTILRWLAGLQHAELGWIQVREQVWFDSEKGIQRSPQARGLGLAFQESALFPHLNVEQNLEYALTQGRADLRERLLDELELTDLRERSPAALSGGQKQRVGLGRALARAVSAPTRLLLLDETFSAQDVNLRVRLQSILAEWRREFGLTIIMASHDRGEIFRLAQQVIHLANGRVLRAGTPASVFLQHAVSSLQLQAQVLAKRCEDVVWVLSLLVGQEIIEIIASPAEALHVQVGQHIAIAAKTFNPLILHGH